MSMNSSDHLYLIQSGKTGAFKVGRSHNVQKRLSQLQTASPYPLRIILILKNQGWREKIIHQILKRERSRATGEWFNYEALPFLPAFIYEKLDLDLVDWWWTKAGKAPDKVRSSTKE